MTFCVCVSRRLELAGHLKQWHLKVIEIVKRGQHRKSLDKLFQGFKPAVEACYFNWEAAYPLEGITYCSAEKKSATFCWSRAMQLQRGARAAAAGMGDGSEPGGGAPRAEGFSGDYKGRGAYSSQQEVAVRPKDTKRKALSMSSGGGVLVRLGGSVSLSLEDAGAKCMYKGPSPPFGGKMKAPPGGGGGKGSSVGGPGGGGPLAAAKHGSAKRRTSSEDSSLEPDLAELSLDDGSSLALGAEASNTFEFLPPAPEMLPSLSPLLRDAHKHGCNGGGGKMFEAQCAGPSSGSRPAAKTHPPGFLCKEGAGLEAGPDVLAAEKEAELEVLPAESREEDVDSTSTSTARSSTTVKLAKPVQNARPEVGPACRRPGGGPEGGAGAAEGAAEDGGEEAVEEEVVGEDDYQAYYVGVASEEGLDRQLGENLHQEEEPDIFAGIKPLEQENRMEVRAGMTRYLVSSLALPPRLSCVSEPGSVRLRRGSSCSRLQQRGVPAGRGAGQRPAGQPPRPEGGAAPDQGQSRVGLNVLSSGPHPQADTCLSSTCLGSGEEEQSVHQPADSGSHQHAVQGRLLPHRPQ